MNDKMRIVEIGGKKEWLVDENILDRFALLAAAERCTDKNEAWEILRSASILFHPLDDAVFNTLYGSVAISITQKFRTDEHYYQRLFKKRYSEIRCGEIANVKTNAKDIPDAWVKKKDKLIPVEVKTGNFNRAALRQLIRYINAYSSEYGIAVARRLTVRLPSNIEFISIDELEEE